MSRRDWHPETDEEWRQLERARQADRAFAGIIGAALLLAALALLYARMIVGK